MWYRIWIIWISYYFFKEFQSFCNSYRFFAKYSTRNNNNLIYIENKEKNGKKKKEEEEIEKNSQISTNNYLNKNDKKQEENSKINSENSMIIKYIIKNDPKVIKIFGKKLKINSIAKCS